MNNIFVNSVIEWCDQENNLLSIERVLWVSPQTNDVVLIRIDEEQKSLPFYRDYSEVLDALETPYVKKLNKDPLRDLLNINVEFINKHKEKRDKAWMIIKDLVELEPFIYVKEERGELIRDCKKKHGVRSKYIYKRLKQYWVGGKTKNSLLPLYKNSGEQEKIRGWARKK